MPYTLPTSTEFIARFPAFAAVDDGYIDLMIGEAARNVDDSWAELDYQPAIMFLAAHNMVEEGILGRDIDASGAITSSKLGDAQDSYASPVNSDSSSIYGSTVYGRRFAQLQRVNVQAVVLL